MRLPRSPQQESMPLASKVKQKHFGRSSSSKLECVFPFLYSSHVRMENRIFKSTLEKQDMFPVVRLCEHANKRASRATKGSKQCNGHPPCELCNTHTEPWCNPREYLEEPIYNAHVGKSIYALQLRRWFGVFGRESFKVRIIMRVLAAGGEPPFDPSSVPMYVVVTYVAYVALGGLA